MFSQQVLKITPLEHISAYQLNGHNCLSYVYHSFQFAKSDLRHPAEKARLTLCTLPTLLFVLLSSVLLSSTSSRIQTRHLNVVICSLGTSFFLYLAFYKTSSSVWRYYSLFSKFINFTLICSYERFPYHLWHGFCFLSLEVKYIQSTHTTFFE